MSTVVAGLDLSLDSTGMAVVEENLAMYVISFGSEKSKDLAVRTGEISDLVLLTALAHNVTDVFIENYAFSRFQKSNNLTMLAELGGVVKWRLYEKGINCHLVSPGTLKKFFTGKGTGKKEKWHLLAFKKFGVEFENTDEIDAYILADFGYHILNPNKSRRNLLGYEEKVLADYLKKEGKK
jgi:crossover junction endodeoxyribonuclease RuvC